MQVHLTAYVMWVAAPVMQVGVLVAMYRRGLHRRYPCFFGYTLLQILYEPILFVSYRQSYTLYYNVYYAAIVVSVLASIAVLHDLFRNGFRTDETTTRLSGLLLVSTVFIFITKLLVGHPSDWSHDTAWVDWLLLSQRTMRITQCGLLYVLFTFRKRLGIARRELLVGIVAGFGLFSAVDVLTRMTPLRSHQTTLRQIDGAAYLLACVIWLAYAMGGSSEDRGYCWKRVVPQ